MKSAIKIIVFFSFWILGGCSWLVGDGSYFDDSQYDYTKAELSKEMQVPASVGEANIQDHFLVPELDDEVRGDIYGVDKAVLAPMQILTLGNKVRANRSSKNSSAFITESEIRLWDIVQRYLEEENIQLRRKDLQTGTLVTDWQLEDEDSFWWSGEITAWRYRYHIKLEAAKRAAEQKLTVMIIEAQEFVDATGKWRAFHDTKRVETQFLNSILGFMYVEDIATSRESVNKSALGGLTVTLGTDKDNNAALVTSASFEHLWTRLPISLSQLKISVEDQDRSKGLFFINQKGDDKGFFASLAFWSNDSDDVLDIPVGAYRIQLAETGDKVTMTFIDGDNQALTAEVMARNFPKLAKAFRSRALD